VIPRTGVTIMLRLLFLSVVAAAAVAAGPQAAAARTLEDCEKIRDWHAYNTCLASFGPRRGQRAVSNQPRAEGPEGRVYGRRVGAAQSARRGPRGLVVQRSASGRVRATFDIGGPVTRRR
jgi:hypothetical protein